MRVGRPAGSSVVAAPDAPPRSGSSRAPVVVGNLGYDVSFTLPNSHSLLLAFPDTDTAAAVEAVYTEAVGAPSAGWSASAKRGAWIEALLADLGSTPGRRPGRCSGWPSSALGG
jgi:hypothetical protein